MPILNYTTSISVHKTLSEIQQALAKAGANKIIIDNDAVGNPISVTFHINWKGVAAYSLPCNFEGVLKAMRKNRKVPRNKCNEEQALRVGWRIVKDWIEAQLAIVEAELASLPQIFLPYVVTDNNQTLYDRMESSNGIKLLN